jgi:SAM-dependent methyltransferase
MAVLDVGGGTGGDAMTLAARVTQTGRVLVVDLSRMLLAEARRKLRAAAATGIDLLCADVTALPFPNDSWDRVRADRVLQHVPDAAGAVREMTRVLKPEGVLVVCDVDWDTLVLDHPARETTRAVLRQRVQSAPSGTVGRALLRHCVDAGLHAVDAEATTFTFRDLSLADPIVGLRQAALALAESNATDLDELAEWLTTMEELDRRGRFFCAVTGFAAWGRKPSG